jgi:4-hydroxybenzoate polyprenyltransferase
VLSFKLRMQRGLLFGARYLSVVLGVPALVLVLVMGWRIVAGPSLSTEDWIAALSCLLYVITFVWFQSWSGNALERIADIEKRNNETSEPKKDPSQIRRGG